MAWMRFDRSADQALVGARYGAEAADGGLAGSVAPAKGWRPPKTGSAQRESASA